MSPSTVIATLSPDLTARLQRVGASLTDNALSRRSTRPAMSAGDPAPSPRPRRGMLAALVVAVSGLAVGTLTFGGRTNDPALA